MRIFFTTPYSGKRYFQPYIDEAFGVLEKSEAIIISPENNEDYANAIREYQARGMQPAKAHYAFTAHGIAEADIVIIEASYESLRVGHEITLALLYGKPTLVLSQNKNYADYISHELLTGIQYKTKRELRKAIEAFLKAAKKHLSPKHQSVQTLEAAADSLRLTTFATMRQHALQDEGEFGNFADLAERNPEDAYNRIMDILGDIPVEKPWSIFASIYNEDTPDFIFRGVMQFVLSILKNNGIKKKELVVDTYTHTGAVARYLSEAGYSRIVAFSPFREMLGQTYHYCADNPEITIIEAEPARLQLTDPAKAIVWIDYTTNFALTRKELKQQLQNLINNLAPNGCLIFDVRTTIGWKIYFFNEKVATFSTPNFQRISVNQTDDTKKLIYFDRFIRKKENSGLWGEWRREQMVDRMWSLNEVKSIVKTLSHCNLEGIYNDDFSPLVDEHEPNLAYFVLKRQ